MSYLQGMEAHEAVSTKQDLRRRLRTLGRELITEPDRVRWSSSIVEQLRRDPLWSEAQHVGLYSALPDEPCLQALIDEVVGVKSVYLPRVLGEEEMAFYPFISWDSLERSRSFGLYEPTLDHKAVSPEQLDLLIIPALAFDSEGYRLGRGKGYYDHYLAQTKARRIGVSFGLLRPRHLPTEPWDLPMDRVYYPLH